LSSQSSAERGWRNEREIFLVCRKSAAEALDCAALFPDAGLSELKFTARIGSGDHGYRWQSPLD
jgi:hypothetical protein